VTKQAMRYLALVIAVFVSWTVIDSPSSFAADSMSPNPDLAHIIPATPERRVTHIQELFLGNIFRFVAPDDRGVILSTPNSLGDIHVDGETDIKSKTQSSPLHVTCPDSASAVLRPIFPNYPVPNTRKLRTTIHYGKLGLRFMSAPKPDDSLCTLVSQRGALPIIADFRVDPGTRLTVASQQIAASVTTATLDFIPTRTDIRHCDLSLLESLSRADLIDSTKPLPSGSEKCYLNEPGTAATNGLTVRWSIPGFEEYTPGERGLRVYKTQALTYYVDLNSLLATNDVRSINSLVVDCLENYIHQTLIKNLPAITPIGIAQVSPAV
jgi:hypothetical protein